MAHLAQSRSLSFVRRLALAVFAVCLPLAVSQFGCLSPGEPLPNNNVDSGASDGASVFEAGPILGSCKPPPGAGYLKGLKTSVLGVVRNYNIALPPSYDSKKLYPVVFAFHGDGGTGDGIKGGFNFESKHADEAIFVYPDGLNAAWDLDTFDASKNPDVQLIDNLVAELKSNYCVQPARFYATGFSRGGFFSNHLACMRGGVFAAVAAQGGGGPYDATGKNFDNKGNLLCPAPKKIPILMVIGGKDGLLKDSLASQKHWRWSNGCSAASVPAAPAPCVEYQGCANAVKWCEIPSDGHKIWSEGTEAAWQFFMAH